MGPDVTLEKYLSRPVPLDAFDKYHKKMVYTYHSAKMGAWILIRTINHIIDFPEKQTYSALFEIRQKLFTLHYFNCRVKMAKSKYPYSRTLERLIQRYIILEYKTLNKNNASAQEMEQAKARVWHFLGTIHGATSHFKGFLDDRRNMIYFFNVLKGIPCITEGFLRSLMEKVINNLQIDFTELLNKPIRNPLDSSAPPEVTNLYNMLHDNPIVYISDESDYESDSEVGKLDNDDGHSDPNENKGEQGPSNKPNIKTEVDSDENCYQDCKSGVVVEELNQVFEETEELEAMNIENSMDLISETSICEDQIEPACIPHLQELNHCTEICTQIKLPDLNYEVQLDLAMDEEIVTEFTNENREVQALVIQEVQSRDDIVKFSTVTTHFSKTVLSNSIIETSTNSESNKTDDLITVTVVCPRTILDRIEEICPPELKANISEELPEVKTEIAELEQNQQIFESLLNAPDNSLFNNLLDQFINANCKEAKEDPGTKKEEEQDCTNVKDFWLRNDINFNILEIPSNRLEVKNLDDEILLIYHFNKSLALGEDIEEYTNGMKMILNANDSKIEEIGEATDDKNLKDKEGEDIVSTVIIEEIIENEIDQTVAEIETVGNKKDKEDNLPSQETPNTVSLIQNEPQSEDLLQIPEAQTVISKKDKNTKKKRDITSKSSKMISKSSSRKRPLNTCEENDPKSIDDDTVLPLEKIARCSEDQIKFDEATKCSQENLSISDESTSSENGKYKAQTLKKNSNPQKNGELLARAKFPIEKNLKKSKNCETQQHVPTTNLIIENTSNSNKLAPSPKPIEQASLESNKKDKQQRMDEDKANRKRKAIKELDEPAKKMSDNSRKENGNRGICDNVKDNNIHESGNLEIVSNQIENPVIPPVSSNMPIEKEKPKTPPVNPDLPIESINCQPIYPHNNFSHPGPSQLVPNPPLNQFLAASLNYYQQQLQMPIQFMPFYFKALVPNHSRNSGFRPLLPQPPQTYSVANQVPPSQPARPPPRSKPPPPAKPPKPTNAKPPRQNTRRQRAEEQARFLQQNISYQQQNSFYPQENPSYPQKNRSNPPQNPSYSQQNPSNPVQNPSYPQQNPSNPPQNHSYLQQNPSYPQQNPCVPSTSFAMPSTSATNMAPEATRKRGRPPKAKKQKIDTQNQNRIQSTIESHAQTVASYQSRSNVLYITTLFPVTGAPYNQPQPQPVTYVGKLDRTLPTRVRPLPNLTAPQPMPNQQVPPDFQARPAQPPSGPNHVPMSMTMPTPGNNFKGFIPQCCLNAIYANNWPCHFPVQPHLTRDSVEEMASLYQSTLDLNRPP